MEFVTETAKAIETEVNASRLLPPRLQLRCYWKLLRN